MKNQEFATTLAHSGVKRKEILKLLIERVGGPAKFAQKAGLSRGAASRMVSTAKCIQPETAEKIRTVLGVEPETVGLKIQGTGRTKTITAVSHGIEERLTVLEDAVKGLIDDRLKFIQTHGVHNSQKV